ncbi:MAG: lysoplasmalogenase [Deltaproteobacteria bacterium]|nr:lysoplasmalogenase [Deltaproteobacteria bacterium]
MTAAGACIAATALCLALHLYAEARGRPVLRALTKLAASLGFVGLALALGVDAPFDRLVLAALLLSLLGDALLLSAARPMFLAGLVAFLLAHVAYAVAFLGEGSIPPWPLPLLALGVGLVLRWLWPHLGPMKGPVVAYCVVIAVMVAAAMGVASAEVRAGAVLFFLSDLLVARDRFVAPGLANRAVGLPLYYGAQLLLASAVG